MVVALGPGKFYGSSLPRPRIYTDVKLNSERVDPPTSVVDPFLSWANEAHWSMGGLSFKRQRLQGRIEGSIKKLRAESERIIRNKKRIDSKESAMRDADKRAASPSVSPPPAPISKKRRRYMALIDDEEEEEIEETKENGGGGGGGGGDDLSNEDYVRRRPARKLGDDFDRVASENLNEQNVITKGSNNTGLKKSVTRSDMKSSDESNMVSSRTRSQRSEKVIKVDEEVKGSNSKSKKLMGGSKRKSDGEKGLSPAAGIRTSPRLSKRGST